MAEFIDQIGHKIKLPALPKRIISLVPSQTELLSDLGLSDEVIGITKFCIHPLQWYEKKTRVGGTKKNQLEKIQALKPDLILANKEENTQDEIELLQSLYPVWTSDINDLSDSLDMITQLGIILGKGSESTQLINEISSKFKKLNKLSGSIKVLYLIWRNPFMGVGENTFINDMMLKCGFRNILEKEDRYPMLNKSKIKELNPDCILLSSEPYPFKYEHVNELQQILPDSKIIFVDGEMFSWYGSRLKYAPKYFNEVIKNA